MPSIVSPQLSKALHTFRCKLSLWVPNVGLATTHGGWGMQGVGVFGLHWLPEGEEPVWPSSWPAQYNTPEYFCNADVGVLGSFLLDTGCG